MPVPPPVTIAVLPVSFMCRSDSGARLSPAGPAMSDPGPCSRTGWRRGRRWRCGRERDPARVWYRAGSLLERGRGGWGGARRLSGERAVDVGDDGPHDGRVLHEGDDEQPAATAGTGVGHRGRTRGASARARSTHPEGGGGRRGPRARSGRRPVGHSGPPGRSACGHARRGRRGRRAGSRLGGG